MKNLLITALLALLPITASAENWNPLTETIDGAKLIVDYDSIAFKEYYKDTRTKSWLIHADMYLVSSNTPIKAYIDAKECLLNNSGTLVLSHDGETYSKPWSYTGNKVSDAQGVFLCHVTKKLLEVHSKQERKIAI